MCLCASACNSCVFVQFLHAGALFLPVAAHLRSPGFLPLKPGAFQEVRNPIPSLWWARRCSFCSAHSVHTRHPSPISAPVEKSIAAPQTSRSTHPLCHPSKEAAIQTHDREPFSTAVCSPCTTLAAHNAGQERSAHSHTECHCQQH